MASFNLASAEAASVPLRRRLIQQPAATPAPTQPVPTSFLGGSLPWPRAPEQPPIFQPPVAPTHFSPPFPPAPPANPAWQTGGQAPPMAASFAVPPTPSSPFGVGPPAPPVAAQAQPPLMQTPPVQAVPAWAPAKLPAFVPANGYLDEGEDDDQPPDSYRPAKRGSKALLVLFFLTILGLAVWVLWDNLELPFSFNPSPAPHLEPATDSGRATGPGQQAAPATPAPAPPATAATKPEGPEVRRPDTPEAVTPTMEVPKRKEEPPVDLAAANQAAGKMLRTLMAARSAEERATLVAHAEDYREEMADFFSKPVPQIKSISPAGVTPRLLPGQAVAPLFQVITSANESGALLRLAPQADGSFLLDWPLFAETHARRLGNFFNAKTTDPAWFHTGLRRTHALGLSSEVLDKHFAFDLQGSADGAVRGVALVQRETPLGRYLDQETEWSAVYLARLLLQFRPLSDGSKGLVILDCESATTGASGSK